MLPPAAAIGFSGMTKGVHKCQCRIHSPRRWIRSDDVDDLDALRNANTYLMISWEQPQ